MTRLRSHPTSDLDTVDTREDLHRITPLVTPEPELDLCLSDTDSATKTRVSNSDNSSLKEAIILHGINQENLKTLKIALALAHTFF